MRKKPKINVERMMPLRLKEAIDQLPLSRIMKEKTYKCVSIIIQKGIIADHGFSEYIPLPTKYLEKVFNSYYHTDFFNLLKNEGIIECDERYSQGSKVFPGHPKGYRINRMLLEGEMVKVSYLDQEYGNYNEDHFILSRTYFPGKEKLNVKNKNFIGSSSVNLGTSIVSVNPTQTQFTNHSSSTSSLLHISTEVFEKSAIFDYLSSLHYDVGRFLEIAANQSAYISTEVLKTGAEILEDHFEVQNNLLGKTYYSTRTNAINWANENKASVIQDQGSYFIDDLDVYVDNKRHNMLASVRWKISHLENNLFYATRNDTNGRLDHNLTALNREILKVIKEDNGLVEIDLKNSQFAIHSYWLKQEGLCLDEDTRLYYEICSKGVLYEELASILQLTRDQAKKTMMELAFSSYNHHSAAKKMFMAKFPNVLDHIDGFKKLKRGSNSFSIELQQLESEMFIDNLYPSIKGQGLFCLTKHDSLLVRRNDKEAVLKIIQDYFKWLEFQCAIDVEGEKILV